MVGSTHPSKVARTEELETLSAAAREAFAASAADTEQAALANLASAAPYAHAARAASAVVAASNAQLGREEELRLARTASDALVQVSSTAGAAAQREEDRVQRGKAAATARESADAISQSTTASHGAIKPCPGVAPPW